MDWYNAQSDTRALPPDASDPAPTRKLIDACHLLSPNRGGMAKPMRVLICGDEAGITKLEARHKLGLPEGAVAAHDEELLEAIGRKRAAPCWAVAGSTCKRRPRSW
ncbi:hypothetical protein ASE39_14660 [Acidovorax sp. Root267]|nr:hypothetical protein ASE39_14660 [Acidovorax sp. Root267]